MLNEHLGSFAAVLSNAVQIIDQRRHETSTEQCLSFTYDTHWTRMGFGTLNNMNVGFAEGSRSLLIDI